MNIKEKIIEIIKNSMQYKDEVVADQILSAFKEMVEEKYNNIVKKSGIIGDGEIKEIIYETMALYKEKLLSSLTEEHK